MVQASELNIDTGASATEMAQTIFGDGVTVVSATYSGSGYSSGTYSGGDTTSPGVTPSDTGVILSTGRARDFTNSSGQANQDTNTSTNTGGQNNNPDFNAAAGARTYDASYMDVDFIPTGDTMTMQFVFSSDEFPEYANSSYQDFVGVWVNGAQATMAIGDANPGNLVGGINQNLYVDNTSDQYNTEMDGFTVTMTLTFPVVPNVVNSIRIGIADVGDSRYDSNLLIAGDSVQTVLIANDDVVHLPGGATKTIDVLANDYDADGGTLTITHINGVPVSVGDTVTLATGQTVTLNADGTLTMVAEADGEYFNFTYTIDDGNNVDTGFVLVDSIPCFVAGTLIATPHGDKRVESLEPGDMVLTHDNGPQPLRWIGRRTVPAEGSFAPIRIAADTFGRHGELLLSPQHRVLIRDALAELLFGETEVLVAAKDLVNDRSVRRIEGGEVEYVHLLFDQHEVIFSEGLATESFLPGPQTTRSFEADLVREICTLFPEIDPDTGLGYSPSARRTLRAHEAKVLMSAGQAA
ncbi:Hint domain-containing protein [Aliiroseovarius sp.]|uniref:Hint domain-containing protein n=1 Tax=Aliiroseovarius sp. TaxID=1872442 RepID=UPI003BA873CB